MTNEHIRAGQRIFITHDDPDWLLVDSAWNVGPLRSQATITGKHSKDVYTALTDSGEHRRLRREDFEVVNDYGNGPLYWVLGIVAVLLAAAYLFQGSLS